MLASGHRFAVCFLGICCGFGLLNMAHGLWKTPEEGVLLAPAQAAVVLFAGTAAWSIYRGKKVGWYLGMFIVLLWFWGLVNRGLPASRVGLAISPFMAIVGLWLLLPSVCKKFEVTKAAS